MKSRIQVTLAALLLAALAAGCTPIRSAATSAKTTWNNDWPESRRH